MLLEMRIMTQLLNKMDSSALPSEGLSGHPVAKPQIGPTRSGAIAPTGRLVQADQWGVHLVESFPVLGMAGPDCARKVKSVLLESRGVVKAEISLAEETAVVRFDPLRVQLKELKAAVSEIGYHTAS